MAADSDLLIVHQAIGDVVEVVVPSVSMSLCFDDKNVTNGSDVKPSLAGFPVVTIGGEPEKFYTLVMTDPDAPSPSKPTLKEWAHWIVADIPAGSTASQGKEMLSYVPPRPSEGIHRYILTLYQQKAPRGFLAAPTTRACFSTRVFAHRNNLGLPVSTLYFNAQPEPSGKKRPFSQCN